MAGRSLLFHEADRDTQGRIAVDAANRSLANLLPPPALAAPPPAGTERRAQLAGLVVVLVALGLGALFFLRPAPTPATPAAAVPTAAPAPPSAAEAALPVPTAVGAACTVLRAAPTYYAPAGAPTGDAAERGQACALVAWHSGLPEWRQVRIAGGAPVWIGANRLSITSTASLVDLAPPPATQTPIVIIREVPVMVPPAPCTEQNASHRARRDPRGSEPPIGYAIAWSCVSQADADSKAEQGFQDLLRSKKP